MASTPSPKPIGQLSRAKFTAYEGWTATKTGAGGRKARPQTQSAKFSPEKPAKLSALIAKDKALEPEANAIAAVDRLIRYHRDLYKLLNNFVSFRDFYRRKDKAIFQAGTLYLDQRSCDLCLTVEEPAATRSWPARRHISRLLRLRPQSHRRKNANRRGIHRRRFRQSDGWPNGIFYDRKGRDWDATITQDCR